MPCDYARKADEKTFLVDVSGIFCFSFLLGRGGSPRRREGGGGVGRFLLKIPGGGVSGARGRKGLCSELEDFMEGGN